MKPHADANAVIASETARLAAMVGADLATLETLLHPGLIYLHASGKSDDHASYMAKLREGIVRYAAANLVDIVCRGVGPVASAEGIVAMRIEREGVERESRLAFTSIWHRTVAGWRLCAWAGTREEN